MVRIVPLFIILNIAVFLLWRSALLGTVSADWMLKNFVVSWTGLEEGRYWILLTAVFSHQILWHFLFNILALASFGPIVEKIMGPFRFFRFYMIAGIFSSLCHAMVSAFAFHAPNISALGASGAISGVVLYYSLMFPSEKILIFGLIPISALWGALAFVALDVWGLFAQAQGGGFGIGHGAHLGGAAIGVIYFFFLRNRFHQFSRSRVR